MADEQNQFLIDKINSFYQSTVCHVCKESPPCLKRCAGCKLYAYCSKQHQRYHWPSHKQFCKMVAKLLTKDGKYRKHIFDIEDVHAKTFDEWQQMKVDLKCLWENLLKRQLTYGENQLWMFPRVCEVCRCAQQDLLFDCTLCLSVSYCSVRHQTLHSQSHQNNCQSMKLCFDLNLRFFRYNEPCPVPTPRISANVTALPANMETFVRECTANVKSSVFSQTLAGDMLSPVLTILHALETTNCISRRQFHRQSFVLHLVGAAWYEQEFDWPMFVAFLRHWMTNVRHVTVILVGPDLVLSEQVVNNGDCEKCTIMLERCFYHDYVISRSFITPDLMVAFNCGLHEYQHESDKDTWALSIPCLLSQTNVPLLLTAYTQTEAILDYQRLDAMNSGERNTNVYVQCKENKFRSLRPLRDWSACDSPVFYQNNYITLLTIT